MILSQHNKTLLEEKGIILLERSQHADWCHVFKKMGAPGNAIPYFTSAPIIELNEKGESKNEITSDCPMMMLSRKKDVYIISCWNWVPGPGPGDFEETFTSEEEVVIFIQCYYFGNNKYFEARKKYETDKLAGLEKTTNFPC